MKEKLWLKGLTFILIAMSIFSLFVWGFQLVETSFVNRNSTFNISFTVSNQNETEYIEIPMHARLQNFTVTLRGFESET